LMHSLSNAGSEGMVGGSAFIRILRLISVHAILYCVNILARQGLAAPILLAIDSLHYPDHCIILTLHMHHLTTERA
jgi:hypothetical protein